MKSFIFFSSGSEEAQALFSFATTDLLQLTQWQGRWQVSDHGLLGE